MQWPLPTLPTKPLSGSRSGAFYNAAGVTPGINTKGTWITYGSAISATGPGATGIFLMHRGNISATGVDTATLLDIGVRVGGVDCLVIPNMLVGNRVSNPAMQYIPMYIPPGATPIARASGVRNPAVAFNIHIEVVGGEPDSGLSVPSKFTDYGTDLANSGGTAVTPNATANTKGSWVELTASTTAPIHEMIAGYQLSTATQAAATLYMFDIGVGAAGSEGVVASNIPFQTGTAESVFPTYPLRLPFSYNIPVGSRVAARVQSDAASGEAIEMTVIGITY